MVAYLLAVDRGQRDFVTAEDKHGSGLKARREEKDRIPRRADCQVPQVAD